jgi:hypothetical protein
MSRHADRKGFIYPGGGVCHGGGLQVMGVECQAAFMVRDENMSQDREGNLIAAGDAFPVLIQRVNHVIGRFIQIV